MKGYGKTKPSESKFRYTLGQRVKCRTGANEWSTGIIVALNYSEPDWPPGRTVPYQVQLDRGPLIFVPADLEQLCQAIVPPWWYRSFPKSQTLYAEYNPAASSLAQEGANKDVDEPDHEGRTALMTAVAKTWPNGVSQLIEMKADVNLASVMESRPVHLAAAFGERGRDVLRRLVQARADLNCQDEDPDFDPEFTSTTFGDRIEHRTPLHYACEAGDAPSVVMLLGSNANPNIQDAQYKTPLHVAIDAEEDECIDLLLEHGADINLGSISSGMNNSPLMDAAAAGNTELVRKLIAAGSDVNRRGKQDLTALHLAARSRRVGVVKVLLEAKADLNQDSKLGTALDLARKNGGPDLLAAFNIKSENNPLISNISALDEAQRRALFLD